MQCHNCPKSVTNGGTPDESCLTCKCAEYLDNDHKTVVPVDDVTKLQAHVDPLYEREWKGTSPDGSKATERNREDCHKAIEVFKGCHRSSLSYIACILTTFMVAGPSGGMLSSALDGMNLTEMAEKEGYTRQNASQMWNRMVRDNPMLAKVLAGSKRSKKRATIKA